MADLAFFRETGKSVEGGMSWSKNKKSYFQH